MEGKEEKAKEEKQSETKAEVIEKAEPKLEMGAIVIAPRENAEVEERKEKEEIVVVAAVVVEETKPEEKEEEKVKEVLEKKRE